MNFLAGRRSVFLILPALTGGCGGLLVSADNTDAAAKEPSDAATKIASDDVAPAETA